MCLRFIRQDTPPLNEFALARKAISEARINMADKYADSLLKKSENLFDSAMICWQQENERFSLIRNYSSARIFATQSAEYALKANISAVGKSEEVQKNLKQRLDFLREELMANLDLFSSLPLPEQVLNNNSLGRLNLSEAESAFSKGQFILCEEKLETAEKYIIGSFHPAGELLKDYLKDYQEWQKWVKHTLNYSERNSTHVIIINKIGREIMVYQKGMLMHVFRIELGSNWIGDKRLKGDKATPEGYYTVIQKKQHPQTKFYKALLLDYPNSDDERRFRQAKKTGDLPGTAEIGGFIEIHGEGGRGHNWTDGCIALENSDMDILYRLIGTGTRVTIVGSLKPFEEIW
jgi:HEPN domain-containing protein